MKRGDIYAVDLEPAKGSEANKKWPAIIVSQDSSNGAAERSRRGTVTVVPLTGNTERIIGRFQVLVPADGDSGLKKDSKAQAEQVRTVDVTRLGEHIGLVRDMAGIDDALRVHLAL
jgi:mRNA interferase MazF